MRPLDHLFARAERAKIGVRQKPAPGPYTLLTPREAFRHIGISDAEGDALVRERGLLRFYKGRPRVLLQELLDAHDHAVTTAANEPVDLHIPTLEELAV